MQIVQYVHRTGEGLPDHAQVTEISSATADAVRAAAHGALDKLINDIKTGWTPPTLTAADELTAADASVAAAEANLADAKKAQAEAKTKADAEKTDAAEDTAETTPPPAAPAP